MRLQQASWLGGLSCVLFGARSAAASGSLYLRPMHPALPHHPPAQCSVLACPACPLYQCAWRPLRFFLLLHGSNPAATPPHPYCLPHHKRCPWRPPPTARRWPSTATARPRGRGSRSSRRRQGDRAAGGWGGRGRGVRRICALPRTFDWRVGGSFPTECRNTPPLFAHICVPVCSCARATGLHRRGAGGRDRGRRGVGCGAGSGVRPRQRRGGGGGGGGRGGGGAAACALRRLPAALQRRRGGGGAMEGEGTCFAARYLGVCERVRSVWWLAATLRAWGQVVRLRVGGA